MELSIQVFSSSPLLKLPHSLKSGFQDSRDLQKQWRLQWQDLPWCQGAIVYVQLQMKEPSALTQRAQDAKH